MTARAAVEARIPAWYEFAQMKTLHWKGGEPTTLQAIAKSTE
ncbi:MAG TPA: hypothetical protein VGC45_07335 [Gryllotalpicola sp.]